MREIKDYQDLLSMQLHESVSINSGEYVVTRVLGGWIYCRQEPNVNIANPVFVPISKEKL